MELLNTTKTYLGLTEPKIDRETHTHSHIPLIITKEIIVKSNYFIILLFNNIELVGTENQMFMRT